MRPNTVGANVQIVIACLVAVMAGVLGTMAVADASATWSALILMALGFCALLALHRQPVQIVFAGYVATLPMGIGKGIIAGSSNYYPALSLALSDIFLFMLIVHRCGAILAGARIDSHRMLGAAAIWLGWQWFGAVNSPTPLDGMLAGVNQTKYLVAMWLAYEYLKQPGFWRALAFGLAVAVLMNFAASVLQIATNGRFEVQGVADSNQRTVSFADAGMLNLVRPSGLMSHPNQLAGVLVLFLPAVVGCVMLTDVVSRRGKQCWWAIGGIGSVMLVLTLSRGGWVAMAIGLSVFVLLGRARHLFDARRMRKVVIVAVAGGVLSVAAFPALYLRLVADDNRSTQSRVLLAQQAVLIFEQAPFTGIGLAGYGFVAKRSMPPAFSAFDDEFRKVLSRSLVHNKYLLVVAESGIVGLLLFLNVFRVAASTSFRTQYPDDPMRQSIAIGMLGGLAAMLTVFLAEPSEKGSAIECTWVLMGAMAALSRSRVEHGIKQHLRPKLARDRGAA